MKKNEEMTRMLCQLFKKPQSLPDELSQLVKHELMLSSIASKMKTEFTKMHLLLLIFLVIKKLYNILVNSGKAGATKLCNFCLKLIKFTQ